MSIIELVKTFSSFNILTGNFHYNFADDFWFISLITICSLCIIAIAPFHPIRTKMINVKSVDFGNSKKGKKIETKSQGKKKKVKIRKILNLILFELGSHISSRNNSFVYCDYGKWFSIYHSFWC